MSRRMKGMFGGLAALTLLWPMPTWAGDMTTKLMVQGMTCSACQSAVSKALKQVNGVREVQVSLADKQALVVADESVKTDSLIAAVSKVGFSATVADRN